jgi:hypothetical protein
MLLLLLSSLEILDKDDPDDGDIVGANATAF